MSQIVDIADAVVEELNGESFSQAFTAVRAYVPRYEVKDLKDLTVTVIPGPLAIEGATRGSEKYDYTIMVGIQKKVDDDTPASVDPLMDLVEEIADFLTGRRLTSVPAARWEGTGNDEPFIPEMMDQLRVFTSFVTIGYGLVR